jgi:hypothetical protein
MVVPISKEFAKRLGFFANAVTSSQHSAMSIFLADT